MAAAAATEDNAITHLSLPPQCSQCESAALKTAAAELQASSGIAAVDAAIALPFARPFCPFNRTPNAPEIGRFFQELNYYRGIHKFGSISTFTFKGKIK